MEGLCYMELGSCFVSSVRTMAPVRNIEVTSANCNLIGILRKICTGMYQ